MAKVLLVEDDNNLREIYQARLSAEGYEIIAAQNGEDALVLAKEHHPDLIISDVMMPRISGYEMLDILRNTDGLKHTKVIMLTALGQNEDKERAGKLGADKYLVKSQVTLEDIVNSAKALLADDSVGSPQFTTPDPSDPLGMASTTQADATPATTVSPVAATITPLSVPPEPVSEPVATATAPTEPADEPAAEPVASEPVVTPSTAPATEPTQTTEDSATEPVVTPQPVTDTPVTAEQAPAESVVPAAEPVSVDDLINGNPVATEAVAEVAQAEADEVEPTNAEQTEAAAVVETPVAVEPTPQPQQQNDAALSEALQSLNTSGTTVATPPPAANASEPAEVTPVEQPHQIEGLSGVTEVVEVPSEHLDPMPSSPDQTTPQTAPQPTVTNEAQQPATDEPPLTPMTQTVMPTQIAQPPAQEQEAAPENDGVNVVGKKVIQPLSNPSDRPDLEKLLAQEEAKQAGETLPEPPESAEPNQPTPAAPSKPQNSFDPNNIAL